MPSELIVANQELALLKKENGERAAEFIIAAKELDFQKKEKENRAAELIIVNKELSFQRQEKEKKLTELIIANKELTFLNAQTEKRAAELLIANQELSFQNNEKGKRADELIIANEELAFQNLEKGKRADELIVANIELAFQNSEKGKRAAELLIANKELSFQNHEKGKRADELVIANEELAFQNTEKGKRADELILANKELAFQSSENVKRAAELLIANKELSFQNHEKEKRADELIIADKELVFQNEEKGKRAAELIISNEVHAIQNQQKEKRADQLTAANKELALQNIEKGKRTDELTIVNEKFIKSEAALNKLNDQLEEIVIARTAALQESVKETIKANQDKESVLNRISDGVVSLDNNWRYTFLNDAALNTHPMSKEATLGQVIWDVHPEMHGTIFWDKYHEAMLTKKVVEIESHYAPMNIWFSVKVYPSSDGLTIFYKDVTESKKAEQQLLDSLREISDYKFALDEASIVAITDQKGIIKYVNDNFCKISKYCKEELIGQDHRIINSAYHPKAFIRNLWNTIARGKTWRGELKNKAKDGSIYWVDTTIVPFLNEEGKPFKYLAIRADITKRKEAEERILRMNEELEDKVSARTLELTISLDKEKVLNEMKSRFVSLASHEFRTPLSTILSSVSLIACYNDENQQAKRSKHINRITSSVKDLTGILNDFLSLDKLEHGMIELDTEIFDFSEFTNEILDEVNFMLKPGQEINYVYTGEKELKQDKKVIKNVLLNLLSNAMKYSGENQEIHLTIDASDQKISIQVRDEGIGIPEEEQQYLFQKFYRAKNVNHIQGTGLGLTIVKKYVELLDGTIRFKSVFNEGTIFTVEFPQT
ncbi:MAG TPA: ATP-binding protein [Saprospiraceae bacterium]|nr:ATP-binding protein [Saprospiraceae bacterium]